MNRLTSTIAEILIAAVVAAAISYASWLIVQHLPR